MATFEFEGSLEELNNVHLDFISKVLTELGFKSSKVIIEPVGKPGDNYQSLVKRIVIHDFRIFAKVAMNDAVLRETMRTVLNFQNETAMYSRILPKFSGLLREVGVSDRLRIAECYGIATEEPNEIILLEDLSLRGFKVMNRLEPLPVADVNKVMLEFGAFHAMSYVLKKTDRTLFDTFSKDLKSIWNKMDEEYEPTMRMMESNILKLIDNEKYREMLVDVVVKQTEWAAALEEEDLRENDNLVIIQADAWTNNIMFKQRDGEIEELIMIDYQMSRQGNPVVDLFYHILNCTSYEMRRDHFWQWIDMYHGELTRITKLFNVDINEFLSRNELNRSLKKYAKCGLGLSLMFNGFVLKESEEVFDIKKRFNDREELAESFKEFGNVTVKMAERSVSRLKDRLNGLIKSFEELGYFDNDVWGLY